MSRGTDNSSLGAYGERLAARWLTEAGMLVIERNWRCESGEIDLVLRDGRTLVFCEVKTRRSAAYGHPLEAVGPVKAQRLRLLAGRWMHDHGVTAPAVRIDLVGVLLARGGPAQVEHVRGVG